LLFLAEIRNYEAAFFYTFISTGVCTVKKNAVEQSGARCLLFLAEIRDYEATFFYTGEQRSPIFGVWD